MERVLVSALGIWDSRSNASAIIKRAFLGFKERLWFYGKVRWEGGIAFNKPQDSDYDREHEEDKNKDNELRGFK
jgi:hypothetical protein